MAVLDTQLRATQGSNLCGHKCRGTKGETSGPQLDSRNPALNTQECRADQTCRLFLFILFKTKSRSTTFLNGECWKPVIAKNCSFDDLRNVR